MNDQELQCFLAAAKHLNFSDAANHMFLSPSAFSRNIAKMEKDLHLTLFERDTKNVSLTAAGFFLSQQLSRIYTDYLVCVQKAQMLQMGLSGQLRMGLQTGQSMDRRFQRVLHSFEKASLDFHIVLQRYPHAELMDRLLQKSFDGILTTERETARHRELSCFPVSQPSVQLLLPFLHPLAEKETISLEDLADENLLILPDLFPSAEMEAFTALLTEKKVKWEHCEAEAADQLLLLLESGKGLVLCTSMHLLCTSPSVACRSLPGLPVLSMVFAYHTDNSNPALQRFLDYLKTEE